MGKYKPKAFVTQIELVNKSWLGEVLNLTPQNNGGIDLLGKELGVELKCKYNFYSPTFAIHHYQIGDFRKSNMDKSLYWAFMLYGLNKPPKTIGVRGPKEKNITQRQTWFLPWAWVNNFPVWEPETGPYVYIHKKDFPVPETFDKFVIDSNQFFIPKASPLIERINLIYS